MDQFEEASAAAYCVFRDAVFIATKWNRDDWWSNGGCLDGTPSRFADLIRDVTAANRAVQAIAADLEDSKRDDQAIRFGAVSERTAHQVAVRFAGQVASAILLSLHPGTQADRFVMWPENSQVTDQDKDALLDRWQEVRDAMARIQLGDESTLIELIQIESRRAMTATIPPSGEVIHIETPAVVPDDAEAVKVLIGWDEILDKIGRPDGTERFISRLSKDTNGPIVTSQGKKPTVKSGDLVRWWNKIMQDQTAKRDQSRLDATEHDLEQVPYGKTGTSVPEIGGGIKKRRKS